MSGRNLDQFFPPAKILRVHVEYFGSCELQLSRVFCYLAKTKAIGDRKNRCCSALDARRIDLIGLIVAYFGLGLGAV